MTDTPIYERPAELLQQLIRFDTTNPPGNEGECIAYIRGLLTDAGIDSTILAKDDARPNLIARIPGRGDAPPLLLQGHVDVVTTADQEWTHPPFGGDIHDGYIWGRGALDMKGGVAMMIAAFLRAQAEGASLPGDVILTVLADEENTGVYGARFLVEEHPEQFEGVRFAFGELGGFALYIGGQRFYPIMVAEKQMCGMEITVKGPAGHGSQIMRGGTTAKLGDLLTQLDKARLPVHITPPVDAFLNATADALTFPASTVTRSLLRPALTDRVLDVMGESGYVFDPMLHNTVNATIIAGGDKANVIPCDIKVTLDGRLLPGFTGDDMIRELRGVIGDEHEIVVTYYEPGPPAPDMGLFDTLADILQEADPDGRPVPLLLSAVTDARFFARLGIQTYGFLPMNLPPDFSFIPTVHAADERVPVEAMYFGTEAMYTALQRFGEAQ